MRSFWIRCLIVLVSLSLVGGNARAIPMPGPASEAPCHEHLAYGTEAPEHHHPAKKTADRACCCDCLGCTSSISLPQEFVSNPAVLTVVIRYRVQDDYLTGRALLPEPDPPRPITPI